MSVAGPLPWLGLEGAEFINVARTMGYLRRIEAADSGIFSIADAYPCSLLESFAPSSEGWVSPADDPAPWYDSAYPESGEFLGFIITDITGVLESTATRTVTNRPAPFGGGRLGPQNPRPRVLVVKGVLVAETPCGLEWGHRWIAHTLAAPLGTYCDACLTHTIDVKRCCPPDGGSDDERGAWTIYSAAISDGPRPTGTDLNVNVACNLREIEFTVTAENPYLYKQPVELELDGDGCATVPEPPAFGAYGIIVTMLDAASGQITASGGSLPLPATINMADSGDTLWTYDSAQHRIIDCAVVCADGTSTIILPSGQSFPWIEYAAGCDNGPLTVCATAVDLDSNPAEVHVYTQLREL